MTTAARSRYVGGPATPAALGGAEVTLGARRLAAAAAHRPEPTRPALATAVTLGAARVACRPGAVRRPRRGALADRDPSLEFRSSPRGCFLGFLRCGAQLRRHRRGGQRSTPPPAPSASPPTSCSPGRHHRHRHQLGRQRRRPVPADGGRGRDGADAHRGPPPRRRGGRSGRPSPPISGNGAGCRRRMLALQWLVDGARDPRRGRARSTCRFRRTTPARSPAG